MLKGRSTWMFEKPPVLISCAAVGGPFEKNSAISEDFDYFFDDIRMGEDTFEKAEKIMMKKAVTVALEKINLKEDDMNFLIAGDLMNQIITSSFSARELEIPFLGIFGACSSSMQSLAMASFLVATGGAKNVVCAVSSHNAATEKQFRYPTEYGGQKPPYAQWTVTGAGAGIVSANGVGPKITTVTIGKVIDMGVSDPFNMGGAMAPAAADTIIRHFEDTNRNFDYYDLVVTGDLGMFGHKMVKELLEDACIPIDEKKFNDCGIIIYSKDQPVLSGGSGCGCSATVTYGHIVKNMKKGKFKKVLVIATGALMSPISYQQKESIPSVAHAVSIEM